MWVTYISGYATDILNIDLILIYKALISFFMYSMDLNKGQQEKKKKKRKVLSCNECTVMSAP